MPHPLPAQYHGDRRILAADDDGWTVTCCPDVPDAPRARVEPRADSTVETFFTDGQPDHASHSSVAEAMRHVLGGRAGH